MIGTHWTDESALDFAFAIANDFLDEIDRIMELQGVSRREIADRIGVTEGRVSQIFHNPGRASLTVMVRMARALGWKVAIVAYDDGDAEGRRGPVYAGIFQRCWEDAGKPETGWDLEGEAEREEEGEEE